MSRSSSDWLGSIGAGVIGGASGSGSGVGSTGGVTGSGVGSTAGGLAVEEVGNEVAHGGFFLSGYQV